MGHPSVLPCACDWISVSVQTVRTKGAPPAIAAQKHIEEKQQISLEDMYFLWEATEMPISAK